MDLPPGRPPEDSTGLALTEDRNRQGKRTAHTPVTAGTKGELLHPRLRQLQR